MPSKDGKYVACHDWAPKQRNRGHEVSRAVCLLAKKPSCGGCPHRQFVLRLPMGAGDQTVACPRWEQSSMMKKEPPDLYVPVRRETCLRSRPFAFCSSCPNSRPAQTPRVEEGWYDNWKSGKESLG